MKTDRPLSCPKDRATLHLAPEDLLQRYHGHECRNAAGILQTACPGEWADIVAVLREFRLLKIRNPHSGRQPVANLLDDAFYARGWQEKLSATAILIDERRLRSRPISWTAPRAGSR
jgi:hypothetical protein